MTGVAAAFRMARRTSTSSPAMRLLALLTLLVTVGCADVSSLADTVRSSAPTGGSEIPNVPRMTWDTTYGDMSLSALTDGRVTAYYEGEDGTLDGTLSGSRYTGTWVEPSSAQTCSTIRRGSDHWGRFDFTFNAARDRFEGQWSYCDAAPSRSWAGTKR